MEGSSWRMPPATNGNNPQQHQYQQQHQYSQQLPPPQQQYPQYGAPPSAETWRNAARENNATNNNPVSSSSYNQRDRSRSPRSSPRDRSTRRRSPDDRRRRSRSRDRYRRRSPDVASRGPPKKVFITHLPYDMQQEPLTMLFARQGYMLSEVKIFEKQDRGSIRSMAIVDFVDAASAKKWMEQNQSQLTIPDGRKVAAEFVTSSEEECFQRRDWICASCTLANYQQSEKCFRCPESKINSEALEARGFADIGKREPCDTLLVRDLPAGVTEQSLMAVLQRCTQGQLRFEMVRLSESREFAWVQMRNTGDAQALLNCFNKSPLQIQGSIVVTTFSRRPLSVILAPPSIKERPTPVQQPVVDEKQTQQPTGMQQMPMQQPPGAGGYGQYGAPPHTMGGMQGMPQGMNPMMAPPGMHGMMPQYGMPPPTMQQQQGPPPQAASAAGHMNPSMPPPTYSLPPPGMQGMMQQQPHQQMQQTPQPGMHQSFGQMGGMQQQQPPPASPHQQQLLQSQLAAAAQMGMMPNMGMPPPGMQQPPPTAAPAAYGMQHMQQPPAGGAPPASAEAALLQAQLAAMAAQQAALQAEVQRLAGHGAVPQTPAVPEKLGHIMTPVGLLQQFEAPNPQTFTPEPSSGYMYDSNTKLYYDPKTQYHYNMASGKWTYYDAHFKVYIAVEEREKVQQALRDGFGQTSNTVAVAAATAAEEKKDENKTPSEIAKEMMKWAKKNDKAKVQMSLKPTVKPLETKSAFGSGIAAAAAAAAAGQQTGPAAGTPTTPTGTVGFGTEVTLKMLDRSKNPLAHLNSDSEDEEEVKPQPTGLHHHNQHPQQQKQQPLPQRQPEPVKEEPKVMTSAEYRESMVATLVDRAGKQCLLCRRAFPSVEVLDKHVNKSDLHKKNLEEKQIEWGKAYVAYMMSATDGRGGGAASSASTSAPSSSSWPSGGAAAVAPAVDAYKYRDRAKERRNIHGIDAITADPFGNNSRDSSYGHVSVEAQQRASDAAAARPLDSSNKGKQLLQSMGWTEGAGLGKNLQGIVAPIQAERRVEGTGLGLSGSKITHGMHASHQDKTRAALFARFQDRS